MDLVALADFNLVARHGGFGRAARAAGRPKATLSRRVAELESSLDLRLFERGARALNKAAILDDAGDLADADAEGGFRVGNSGVFHAAHSESTITKARGVVRPDCFDFANHE